ncbi:hypothetical protein JFT92_03600 [Pseudomonas sp. TH35]|nr:MULTISPECIES: hypothetical protein [unclassified Erwinia]MBK5300248.1 hypothetical protein [Bacillus sp. TH86]MBK5309056.1 hypothetical protein [Pseudomonas sp. TH71]MBK5320017.1 hypothetical protein [Bacillus sp. TH59]MBK5334967.1 hypothetical protein [Bacillus sp. TH57]MBK5368260.1 hypothetical protein [Pseudomonas sp. TH40]MBK5379429.1 hypothetical protein [Pseudomonas sp. TH35]MBK5384888.1 hypothetical protein [Pseudomonas sp. TH38]MBK5402183.1 hypothetical protein [Pseudomonas sp. T
MSARNVILMAALPCATTGENTAEVKKNLADINVKLFLQRDGIPECGELP